MLLITIFSTILFPKKLQAVGSVPEEQEPLAPHVYTKEELIPIVNKYADKYGVDRKLAHYIVENESHYRVDVRGDMDITCKRTGQPVEARGLMQLTECYYPQITDEEAFDPEFNLDFGMKLASNKKTCIQQFTTCRNYYN